MVFNRDMERITTEPRNRTEVKHSDAIRFRPEFKKNVISVIVTMAPWESHGRWFVQGVRMNREGRMDSQSRVYCWIVPEQVEEIIDHPGWGS